MSPSTERKRRPLQPACPYCGSKWTYQDWVDPYCTATCRFLAEKEARKDKEKKP